MKSVLLFIEFFKKICYNFQKERKIYEIFASYIYEGRFMSKKGGPVWKNYGLIKACRTVR